MLNQLTRKEWISKSSTANPKGLRAKAVFGIPAVEINQIYSPICEKILSVKESRTSNKKELKSPLILGVTGSVATVESRYSGDDLDRIPTRRRIPKACPRVSESGVSSRTGLREGTGPA